VWAYAAERRTLIEGVKAEKLIFRRARAGASVIATANDESSFISSLACYYALLRLVSL
jgi:hypothetical protein